LACHYDFGCKSATLRNEMAEMSERGYLVQPHTSSGRIPSDRGYRYYVDRLMTAAPVTDTPESKAISGWDSAQTPVEELIQQSCRLLAGMTKYPSAATPPTRKATRLHRFFLAAASRSHVLLVMMLSTGDVEHRVIDAGSAPSAASLERVTNYLNKEYAGRELSELGQMKIGDLPPELVEDRVLLGKVRSALLSAARNLSEDRVFLEGTSHILRQREFQDVARLEQLMSALEQRNILFQVLSQALLGGDVTVVIGQECAVAAMHECSVVASRYQIGDRMGGFIGVVGPTRMNYNRAVGAVGLMAQSLTVMLTHASLD
jgi:heat-inducible transcriptional repressor